MIFCPDGIIPESGLTGPNNIYIYIYIYIYICMYVCMYVLKLLVFLSDIKLPENNQI